MKLGYAPRALRDLEDIATYLNQRSPVGAKDVLSAIKASIDALMSFPEMAPAVGDTGHRRLPILRYPYAVLYRIAGDELLILHIRHTSRRPAGPGDVL
jgi:toxin ParE1/3/4